MGRPKLFSTNGCKLGSPRLRDSKLEAVSAGIIGAARYRSIAQLVSGKTLTIQRKSANAEFMEISLRTNENQLKGKTPKLIFPEARS